MSFRKAAICVLLVGIASSSEAFAQRDRLIGNPIPSQNTLTRLKLTKAWWGQATLDSTRDKVQYLTPDDDKLYVQSYAGIVTAFDSETGKRLWSRQVGKHDTFMFQAATSEDALYFTTGLELIVLQKETGDVLWKMDLQRQPSTSPVADERSVYVSGLDGSVTSYNVKESKALYEDGLLPKYYREAIRWRFNSHSKIDFPPVITPRHVEVATLGGQVYSFLDHVLPLPNRASSTGLRMNYQFETAAPASAPLVVYKDALLVAAGDSRLYSIDARSGTVRWQTVTPRPVVKPFQVVQNEIFLTPERSGLFCVSADTGKTRWHSPSVNQFLAATPTVVYAMDPRQTMVLISRSRGTVLGTMSLPQFSVQLANDRSDRIYMATPTGIVLAMHETAIHDPKFYKFPERQPIMPEFAPDHPDQEDGESGEEMKSEDADSEEMMPEEEGTPSEG